MAHLAQDDTGKYYLSDIWHTEDVQSVRPDLDEDQSSDVLEAVANNHDANYGIHWDMIRHWADALFPNPNEDEDDDDDEEED
jgi:hypothetical protein